MTVKRQHYIPRFYMSLYSEQGNKINTFMKSQKKTLEKLNVQNVGVEGYFYDLTDEEIEILKSFPLKDLFGNSKDIELENIDKQVLEKYFSKEEGKVSVTLNEFLEKISEIDDTQLLSSELSNYLDEQSKKTIAEFMAIQTIRVPSIIESNKNILDSIGLNHDFSDNSFLFFQLSTGMKERVSKHIMDNYDWNLMVIDKPEDALKKEIAKCFPTREFLLSDTPVAIMEDMVLGGKTFSLTLNSKYLIQLVPKKAENSTDKIISAHRNDVRIINEFHMRFSLKYIFYNQKETKKKIESFFKSYPATYTENQGSIIVLA